LIRLLLSSAAAHTHSPISLVSHLQACGIDRSPPLVLAFALIMLGAGIPKPALAQMVDGQVTKIDESAGKITLKHGPLKKFDMEEGMSMVFRVQDPAMLKSVKVGDKVKFEADRINGQFAVTKIQKAK
jgi:Cu(I)/Ag(I) efflux system protein CusF